MERSSLGDIVTNDFRTALIFKEVGIDFCCGGKKTLMEACDEKALDINAVLAKLEQVQLDSASPSQNFKDWDLGFLADYIVNSHHKYVFKNAP